MNLFDEIFEGYDIRGSYPKQLSNDFCIDLGMALGSFACKEGLLDVVISNDGSRNALHVFEKVFQGISQTPINVIKIDSLIPSPFLFALANKKFDLGIYISHGHSAENQVIFRITRAPVSPLSKNDYVSIKNLLTKKDFIKGVAKISTGDLFLEYENFLISRFSRFSGLNLMLGLADAITQKYFPRLFSKLGISLEVYDARKDYSLKLFLDKAKNIAPDLSVYIDYGLGIFHIIDEEGTVYENDKILMLLSDSVLHKNKKSKILFDVKSTELLPEFIEIRGGGSMYIKTGYPHFISEMYRGATLGGEFSGNFYFKDDYFGFDDHIFSILRVIERIFETKRPLSYIMQTYPMRVHTTELKLSCPDDLKHGLIDALFLSYKELPDVVRVDNTDGIRVNITSTGWFLIRASNTGPYLSVRVEGIYEKEAQMILERVKSVLMPFVFVDTKLLDSAQLFVS
ncbi:hypothetical protein HYV31_04205 [candidate division WWE3 bacterium]|nr:hypothetical protein [candidate division WWE3 bacterium]